MVNGHAPRTLAEWLREAWGDPAAGCPPPEAWLAEEQAALGAPDRERLAAHLAGCPACQAERELAAAFDSGEAGHGSGDVDWVVARLRGEPPAAAAPGPPAAGPGNEPLAPVVSLAERRRTRGATWARLAAAAAVAMGIGLAIDTLYVPAPAPPPATGVVRSGAIEALAPVGEVGELPHELRWQAVPGAVAYRVRLETPAGDALWQGELRGSGDLTGRMEVPAETRASMRRAVTYRWVVEALDAQGRVLAASEPTTFRAAPEREPPQMPNDGEPRP